MSVSPERLAALEEAAHALKMPSRESLGDFIYYIRGRESEGWEGPRVTSWGNACVIAEKALRELDAHPT